MDFCKYEYFYDYKPYIIIYIHLFLFIIKSHINFNFLNIYFFNRISCLFIHLFYKLY